MPTPKEVAGRLLELRNELEQKRPDLDARAIVSKVIKGQGEREGARFFRDFLPAVVDEVDNLLGQDKSINGPTSTAKQIIPAIGDEIQTVSRNIDIGASGVARSLTNLVGFDRGTEALTEFQNFARESLPEKVPAPKAIEDVTEFRDEVVRASTSFIPVLAATFTGGPIAGFTTSLALNAGEEFEATGDLKKSVLTGAAKSAADIIVPVLAAKGIPGKPLKRLFALVGAEGTTEVVQDLISTFSRPENFTVGERLDLLKEKLSTEEGIKELARTFLIGNTLGLFASGLSPTGNQEINSSGTKESDSLEANQIADESNQLDKGIENAESIESVKETSNSEREKSSGEDVSIKPTKSNTGTEPDRKKELLESAKQLRKQTQKFTKPDEFEVSLSESPPIDREVLTDSANSRAREDLTNIDSLQETDAVTNFTDTLRNQVELPGRESNEETISKARELVKRDLNKQKDRLLKLNPKDFNRIDTVIAEDIISIESRNLFKEADGERFDSKARELLILSNKFRQAGTETARDLQIRGKPKNFEDGFRAQVAQGIFKVDRRVQEKIAKETNPEKQKEILDKELEHIKSIRKQLEAQGVELDKILQLDPKNPADLKQLSLALREIQATKASKGDGFYEFWRNSILSGVRTQSANIVGNTLNVAWDFTAQRFAEAIVNTVGRNKDEAQFGEMPAAFGAMLENMHSALKAGILSFQTELPVFDLGLTGKIEPRLEFARSGPSISGVKGRIIRWPQRLLLAADQVAKSQTFSMQMNALAYRQARSEGKRGKELSKRIREIIQSPGEQLEVASLEKADELTFQQELNDFTRKIMNLRQGNSAMSWIARVQIPFVQTPINIARTGFGKAPGIGLFSRSLLGRKISNNQIAAEQILGIAVLSVLYGLTLDDDDGLPRITGSRLFETKGKSEFDKQTLPAQSIRVGDRWFSYARLEPFATTISLMVDGLTALNEAKSGQEAGKVFSNLRKRITGSFRDKTFLRGIGDFIRLIEGDLSIDQFFTNFFASWNPNIIRSALRSNDEFIRNYRNQDEGLLFWRTMGIRSLQKGFPLGEIGPAPKVDHWGRAIKRDDLFKTPGSDWLYRMTVPVATQSVANTNNLDRMIINFNNKNPNDEFYPSYPSRAQLERSLERRVFGKKVQKKVSPEEWNKFMKRRGEIAFNKAKSMSWNFNNPTQVDRRKLEKVFIFATKKAKLEIFR